MLQLIISCFLDHQAVLHSEESYKCYKSVAPRISNGIRFTLKNTLEVFIELKNIFEKNNGEL